MFAKLTTTSHPPKKATMVWDGDCGFCHYWILRWKAMTGDLIEYVPYQKIAKDFKDIDPVNFQEAVRLIEPDGKIYNGPEAAYRSYALAGKNSWMHELYQNMTWFRKINDHAYDFMAKNRPFMMKVTQYAFGKNPRRQKPYWAFYFAGLFLLLVILNKSKDEHSDG